ncbi:MerR family transcriptional regulator [Bacillus sp. JJ722]|uniref:MerR family transcriptional regulator n=1 Tax=Bacillus sp. JJ722 TaxID=3122973 RepID=UPI002FFDE19E
MNYTISQLAEIFGLTTRTIRYYEELQLLKPKRDLKKRRIYSNKEYVRLKLIIRGKQLGFSLEEIKEMVQLFDQDPTGEKQLERTIEYGNMRIEEVNAKIHDLVLIKNELERLRSDFVNRLEKIRRDKP